MILSDEAHNNIQEESKMKKYNLSKIMRQAWELVKKAHCTISIALKAAWYMAKKAFDFKDRWGMLDDENARVSFWIWTGYGHVRAYYTQSWMSDYHNRKKDNFLNLDSIFNKKFSF